MKDFSKINLFKSENYFKEFQNVKSVLKYGKRMSNPELSIMIIAYKRTDFIKDAILSALNQATERIYEVVVIDNSEEDCNDIYDAVRTIDNTKLSYYRNERNIGTSANMNRCAELAGAEYFTILCDDDILLPNFTEEMLSKIALVADCAAIGARYDYIDERSKVITPSHHKGEFYQAKSVFRWLLGYQFSLAGSLFSRKHFLELGGLDPRTAPGSDVTFCFRLNLSYKCYIWNKVLSQYRVWKKMGSSIPEVGYDAASFIKWFTVSLGEKLHLDSYFLKLNTRKLVIEYEITSDQNFKAGCHWKNINESMGITPLTDIELEIYDHMKTIYMRREAIGVNGETIYVGDMSYKLQ